MRRAAMVSGVLLALWMAAQAADEKPAAKPPDAAQASARIAKLRSDPDLFCLSLEYCGPVDAARPRRSLTLSTRPIPRVVPPGFRSEMVIDAEQARKIISWLEKDGFARRAEESLRPDASRPGYELRVGGPGVCLAERMALDMPAFHRMDALAAALQGPPAEEMKQLGESLKDVRLPLEAAEQMANLGPSRGARFKADLDAFSVTIEHRPKAGGQEFNSLTLSARPGETSGRQGLLLREPIDAESAKKLIDRLVESRILSDAESTGAGVFKLEDRLPRPRYAVVIRGRDTTLEADLGWGPALLEKLKALRAALDGGAAAKMDQIIAAASAAIPPEAPTTKEAPAVVETPKPAPPAKTGPDPEVLQRAAKAREDLANFDFAIDYFGGGRFYRLRLGTRDTPDDLDPMHLRVTIDKAQAAALVDRLEKDGFFERAGGALGLKGGESCYLLCLGVRGLSLAEGLGWRDPMLQRLESLRTALDGAAAKKMDVLLGALREEKAAAWRAPVPAPTPAPVVKRPGPVIDPAAERKAREAALAEKRAKEAADRAAAARAKLAADRAAQMKAHLEGFHLWLQYREGEMDPFYKLVLATEAVAQDPKFPFVLTAVIDQETAGKIVDNLQKSGVLGDPPPPRVAPPGPRRPAMPPPPPPPAARYCKLIVSAGGALAEIDLGWDQAFLDRVVGVRAPLRGDAAEKMDRLLNAVVAVTEKEAAKAREERAKLAADRVEKVRSDLKGLSICIGGAGTPEASSVGLVLSSCPFQALGTPEAPWVVLDEKQARALVDRLLADGFFERAVEKSAVEPGKPTCAIVIASGGAVLREDLGWGDAPAARLKSLLSVLSGDAATELGKVAARVGG